MGKYLKKDNDLLFKYLDYLKYQRNYSQYTIQLACLSQNKNGKAFWQAMGFKEIARSYWGHEEVVIFEKQSVEVL